MSSTVYPFSRYVSGTYKREDDISGFDYLRSELVKDFEGLIVHPKNRDPLPRNLRKRKRLRRTTLKFD